MADDGCLSEALRGLTVDEKGEEGATTTHFIDTKDGVSRMTKAILSEKTPEIAIDFEGVDLCRDGELCIAQISDGKSTWIVDITTLGDTAFESGLSDLFERTDLLKVGFDGRADADALFHLHKTKLNFFYDIQIASCKRQDSQQCRRDRFVHGLGKATTRFLLNDPKRAAEMTRTKEVGLGLFAPERGGSYDVWKQRPMNPALVAYAAADVALLLEMKRTWLIYSSVNDNTGTSSTRLKKAVSAARAAKGRSMAMKDF